MRPRTMIAVAATIAVVGGIFAWQEYARGHAATASRKAAHAVDAPALLEAFRADEQAATATYVGAAEQVIAVEGRIRAIERDAEGRVTVVLDTGDEPGIECAFAENNVPDDWRPGAQVTIKGICTGMDDLFGHIILTRCVAV